MTVEKTRYGDGTWRPVNETTRASRAPAVLLRDAESGLETSVDARLTCLPGTPKYHDRNRLEDDEVDRRDVVELATVPGGTVYLDDPLGGSWRRYVVVVPARFPL
jgi:hypothetical protein